MTTERLLTLMEVADMLRVSPYTIRAWIRKIGCGLSEFAESCSSPRTRWRSSLKPAQTCQNELRTAHRSTADLSLFRA